MTAALQIENLTVDFGTHRALDHVSLTVELGSVVAVHGPNGAGKSTLLWTVAGLVLPSAGKITYPVDNSENRDIGFLSHQSFLYEDLTVLENLVLAARLNGVVDPETRAREYLDRVGANSLERHRVSGLSRGQIQRVAFARAALPEPNILLLDELFSNLDSDGIDRFGSVIRSLSTPDRIILLAGHDRDAYARFAERQVELRDGRVTA